MANVTHKTINTTTIGDGGAIQKWTIETFTLAPNLHENEKCRPIIDRDVKKCSEKIQQFDAHLQEDQSWIS